MANPSVYFLLIVSWKLAACGGSNPLGRFHNVDSDFDPAEELEEAASVVDQASVGNDVAETSDSTTTTASELTPHGTGSPSITLKSGVITRLQSATITIVCGETVMYLVATTDTKPAADASGWTTCPSNSFDVEVTLTGGLNTYYVWFIDPNNTIYEPAFSFSVNRSFFFQFTDPDPTASGQFGGSIGVIRLSNGYYAIPAPGNDKNGALAGAVHIYGKDGTLIKSIFGEKAGDQFGSSVIGLPNGNVVAASSTYDNGGVADAGIAMLINSTTGAEISRIQGANANDGFKVDPLTPLLNPTMTNGNYIVSSSTADVSGVTDAGTVILMNGTTGAEIGRISGDNTSDQIGMNQVKVLSNNNIVICTSSDQVGGNASAGSIILMNGSTGAEIGRVSGDQANDAYGNEGATELTNGHYVVGNSGATEGGLNTAGNAMLINGSTGAEIARVAGDAVGDSIGGSTIVALTNGNFVVGSITDEVGGNAGAGSARLVNGSTGAQIGVVAGAEAAESLGDKIVALTNGNFAVGSMLTDNGATNAAGTAILVNGSTGAEIGRVNGTLASDNFGKFVVALTNDNFVASGNDVTVSGNASAGTAVLINGTTGAEIARVSGAAAMDGVGDVVIALTNGNYVLPVRNYDVSGITDAGATILVSGSTGVEIARIVGDQTNDQCGNALALAGGNFLYACIVDDDNGTDTGLVGLADGSTGTVISSLKGDDDNDSLGLGPPVAMDDGNAGWAHTLDDVDGVTDAGSAYLILNN